MRVFLGALSGSVSPVTTHTPLLGAEILLDAGAELTLETDASFEHGLLVDSGNLAWTDTRSRRTTSRTFRSVTGP